MEQAAPSGEQVFETTDLEAASALLREQYSSMRLTVAGERPGLRIVQQHLERARLDRMSLRMDLEAETDPLGAVAVGRVLVGGVAYRCGHEERRYARGDVFFAAQPDDGFVAVAHWLDVDYALLDPSLLGDLAEVAPGERSPVRLLGHDPVSPAAAGHWSRTLSFVQESLRSRPPGSHRQLVTAQLGRLLAATALATFANNALTEPTVEDRRDAHPQSLRRATSFIDDNAHRDIALSDVAAAADVSVRAVQLAFRRHLGCTPTAYLRRVRLHAVNEQLAAAVPGSTTVAEVAAQWGFFNFGRFAGRYRAEFGELPHETLHR